MNKVKGFVLGLILALASLGLIYKLSLSQIQSQDKDFLRLYTNTDLFGSPSILKETLDEGTIPFMGSSELNSDMDKPYWPFNVFKSKETNFLKIGKGGYQSLIHTGTLGAIGNDIKTNKVIFNLSAQWFTPEGIKAEAVLNYLSYETVDGFLRNDKISDGVKEDYVDRILEASDGFEDYQENILTLQEAAASSSPLAQGQARLIVTKEKIKKSFNLMTDLDKLEDGSLDLDEAQGHLDFDKMLEEAQARASGASTSNDLYIVDEYYLEYVRPMIEEMQTSGVKKDKDQTTKGSPEYKDLEIFLRVCQDLGLEALIINVPMQGYWLDLSGYPKEERQAYYENIRSLVSKYPVEFLDLSSYEYEPYFLKDIMHMGEKGWVIIDEKIEEFR